MKAISEDYVEARIAGTIWKAIQAMGLTPYDLEKIIRDELKMPAMAESNYIKIMQWVAGLTPDQKDNVLVECMAELVETRRVDMGDGELFWMCVGDRLVD